MSTLRDKCSPEKLRAHAILDRVLAGLLVSGIQVRWALLTLGETL